MLLGGIPVYADRPRTPWPSQHARLTPSDKLIWGDWTEAKLVCQIHQLAIDGWSCRRIANRLNGLGVPTAYTKDDRRVGRGQRKERIQGVWRAGRTYIGNWGRGFVWYRCNGKLNDRGPIDGRCPAQAIKGPDIESMVWDDIERFLRNPGDILDELTREREMDSGAAIAEAERL